MEIVRTVSTFDATVQALQTAITTGHWPVGSRIPSEATLTTQLGVSRASLREAVRSLTHLGLLQSKQGDGTYVVSDNATDAALRSHLSTSLPEEVLQVRWGLEMVAARLAATHRTPGDLDVIQLTVHARQEAVAAGDREAFATADIAFHTAIAHASHNSVLADLYESFTHSLEEVIRGGQCLDTSLSGQDPYHQQILDALQAGDPAAAASATEMLLTMNSRA